MNKEFNADSRYRHQFEKLIAKCNQNPDINLKTFLVLKDGEEVASYSAENCSLDEKQLLFSVTKSFTSLAVGIACDRGLLALDDKVLGFYPEKGPGEPGDNLMAMTVRDLLTMSSGAHDNTYYELRNDPDWVRAFLNQDFPHIPGTYYLYNTHGSHMLSAIVEKATRMSALDFLNENLFGPMGIAKPDWEKAPGGFTSGGSGLSLTTHELAKAGQLVLNGGVFDGKHLVSKEYLVDATGAHIKKHSQFDDPNRDIIGFDYGYQFHLDKYGNPRMDGAFGQLCLIIPDESMVIAVTSTRSVMENLLGAIYGYFMSGYDEPVFKPVSSECIFYPEVNDIDSICVTFGSDIRISTKKVNGISEDLLIERKGAHRGMTWFIKDLQYCEQPYVSQVVSETADTIKIRILYPETPYVVDISLANAKDKLILEYNINVSLSLQNFIAAT